MARAADGVAAGGEPEKARHPEAEYASAIPWRCGHFPLAGSCDFGSSSGY